MPKPMRWPAASPMQCCRAKAPARPGSIAIEEARLGYARVRMLGRADMANGHGIIHGGMIFALADTAFAYACNGRNAVAVAASASIAFLAPAKIGETLVAEALERSREGRSGVYAVAVRTAEGRADRRIPGRVARDWRRDRRSARGERMTDAFICDAVRTPIGRYGGALASVRPDDLAAVPLRALKERNPGVDWAQLDDIILGCANQAGEDNRNVARMAALLAGPRHDRARHHRQPAVRLGPRRGRHGGAGDQGGRGRADHRRRGRKHDPRAVRHAQGRQRLFARQRRPRHHHRLALRQSRR